VAVEIVQIESNDVVDAIKQAVVKNKINKLVIGASSTSIFSRGQQNLSSRISESIPSFCTVYVISKGILSSLRAADSETIGSSKDDSNSSDSSFVTNSSNVAPSSRTEWTDQGSATSYSQSFSNSLPMQRFEALSSINRTLLKKTLIESSENKFIKSCEGDDATVSDASNHDEFLENSIVSSSRSFLTESQSWTSDEDSIPGAPSEIASDIHDLKNSPLQDNSINFELEKLKVKLRHIRGMYAIAQSESFDASRKLTDIKKLQLEESAKLKDLEAKEQEAKSLAEEERKQHKAAKRLAEYAKECIRREATLRKDVEEMALQDSRDKQKLQHAITGTSLRYREFTWEEIVDACSSFSSYGCCCQSSSFSRGSWNQTISTRVLSRIRHPHLLILIGACVDHGCLVYEYMENGSLDERLFRKNDTSPIPWFDRFRIAWEVASALNFLHNAKPKSIVHRDLKPANILLNKNLVSKIGDVGLSTMLQSDFASTSTIYKDTSEWPIDEAKELAILGLSCAELRRKDRPDLKNGVLPILERLKAVADVAQRSTSISRSTPPNHFICPIRKDVMVDPCVAVDGYTYDRNAIEQWFEESDSSPMTNLPLTSRSLTPNYALLSAILEWKSTT
ncbi:hypothetical protein M8C21_008617, partial [Ambrosia artemisiifolia]